jgi:hypothetical protein
MTHESMTELPVSCESDEYLECTLAVKTEVLAIDAGNVYETSIFQEFDESSTIEELCPGHSYFVEDGPAWIFLDEETGYLTVDTSAYDTTVIGEAEVIIGHFDHN